MASSSEQLEKLITMRTGWNYTPKTAEQIRAQAEGEYQSYYDQLRLAAQQAQAQSDLRLAQQASSLQAAYDEQRENSLRQYRRTYSQADRQLLSRGMQRSSYGNSTLANIDIESARAQDKISQAQTTAQSQIEEQRTQLQQQLAQQMSQYTASQQADIMKRSKELEDIEYNRQVDAWKSQMSMEQLIYEAARQQERDAIADQQWQAQMDENRRQFDETMDYNYSKLKKRGGGGGGSKSTTPTTTTPTGAQTGADYQSLYNNLYNALYPNTTGVGAGTSSNWFNSGTVGWNQGSAQGTKSNAQGTKSNSTLYQKMDDSYGSANTTKLKIKGSIFNFT